MKSSFRHLLVEEKGDVVRVTINRPLDRNSINSELMKELIELLEHLEQAGYRAVVFSGAGETHFIGGADGLEMKRLHPEGAVAFSQRIQALFARMESSPLILVAAIQGLCFGGGYEFALACDVRLAAEDSRIGLPEVKVGLIPGGGGTQRLTRLVGQGLAMEMILSGKLYSGHEAGEKGLVHRVLPTDELEAGVQRMLERILRQPAYVLPLAKQAVLAACGPEAGAGFQEESRQFGRCFEHDFFKALMDQQLANGQLSTSRSRDT